MSRFLPITFLIFAFCSAEGAAPKKLETCHKYEFRGRLSDSLKKAPVLKTLSIDGVPLEIELTAKGDLGLEMITLRGKPVKAVVEITAITSKTTCTGNLTSIELDRPIGLGKTAGPLEAKGAGLGEQCH